MTAGELRREVSLGCRVLGAEDQGGGTSQRATPTAAARG
jgi:hypothetical protein